MDKVTDPTGTPASSRRDFLKLAAAGGAGIAIGSQAFPLAAHAANDDPPSILGTGLTAEYLAVTFYTNVLANAATLGLPGSALTNLRAILAEEAIHVRALQAYGAVAPYSGPFSFPAGTFTTFATYVSTFVTLETAFVAAYAAVVRDLSANARSDLATLAFRVGAVEAEHRAIARFVGGFTPIADVAFEPDLFGSVAAAATFLTNQGFLSPTTGNSYAYYDFNTSAAIANGQSLLTPVNA